MANDWRLMNQEKFLKNMELKFHKYEKSSATWDHDHCAFCTKKFVESYTEIETCTNEGYSTLDNYYWICKECYEDFKEMFNWTIEEN